MKRLAFHALDWLAWALCEAAFRADCRGPFAWLYRWGCALYGANTDWGLRRGFLMTNPGVGGTGAPLYIKRTAEGGGRKG